VDHHSGPLAPFEHCPPAREVPVASYLQDTKSKSTYDIRLQADLVVEGKSKSTPVCKVDLRGAYWSIRDLVAQQTVNGCNINTGDVLATGTISGSTKESHGCLWELTEGGEIAFDLEDGHKRVYLEDGDSIRLSAVAGTGVGFGDCVGTIIPAR
jgi:fumarylacetoacetase